MIPRASATDRPDAGHWRRSRPCRVVGHPECVSTTTSLNLCRGAGVITRAALSPCRSWVESNRGQDRLDVINSLETATFVLPSCAGCSTPWLRAERVVIARVLDEVGRSWTGSAGAQRAASGLGRVEALSLRGGMLCLVRRRRDESDLSGERCSFRSAGRRQARAMAIVAEGL